MGTVTKRPAVDDDLDGISGHIQQSSPDAAHRFLNAAQQAFDLLASQPLAGQAFPHPKHPELRVWSLGGRFRNYAVFYVPTPDGVEIVRVLHGARDLLRALST
ncbi:MAG: type II toxin-antitoxin system RelE/ParE family toxin [Planctomycetota bacterium]